MTYGVDDPRRLLSRRVQDFHEADPAIQAALLGDEYFPVTVGHLVSTALETGYFKDIDECLNYFELERTRLADPEPFSSRQVNDLENIVASDVEGKYRDAADAPYIAWAEAVVETLIIPEEEREALVQQLLHPETPADPEDEDNQDFAENYNSRYTEFTFHEGKLRTQLTRAIQLILRDGFAITVTSAANALKVAGLIPDEEVPPYGPGSIGLRFRNCLGYAAYHGIRREVEEGLIDPEVFEDPDGHPSKFANDDDDFTFAEDRDPIILSAKDLRLFASHYASPHYLEAVRQDPKYISLVGLFKNTPERIEQVQGQVKGLRK